MGELFGVTELAEYLKVNKQTIYNWVNKKEIPFTKIGDLLRFDKDEIDRWFKNKTFRPDMIEYKGYGIEASPYQIAESGNWKVNINIWERKNSQLVIKPISTSNIFPTKEEAIKYCFDFGMKIIDGNIENLTVVDM